MMENLARKFEWCLPGAGDADWHPSKLLAFPRAPCGKYFAACLLGLASVSVCAAEMADVPPELWDRPRSGSLVLSQPGLKQAVAELGSLPAAKLVIHHGGGQETLLQAIELRAWLAALAVDAGRIALLGDLPAGDELKLEVSVLP